MLKKVKNLTRFVSFWVWVVAILIIVLPSVFLNGVEEKNKELNEQNINLNQETKSYSDIVNKYGIPNMINIYGDYLATLNELSNSKVYSKIR